MEWTGVRNGGVGCGQEVGMLDRRHLEYVEPCLVSCAAGTRGCTGFEAIPWPPPTHSWCPCACKRCWKHSRTPPGHVCPPGPGSCSALRARARGQRGVAPTCDQNVGDDGCDAGRQDPGGSQALGPPPEWLPQPVPLPCLLHLPLVLQCLAGTAGGRVLLLLRRWPWGEAHSSRHSRAGGLRGGGQGAAAAQPARLLGLHLAGGGGILQGSGRVGHPEQC